MLKLYEIILFHFLLFLVQGMLDLKKHFRDMVSDHISEKPSSRLGGLVQSGVVI